MRHLRTLALVAALVAPCDGLRAETPPAGTAQAQPHGQIVVIWRDATRRTPAHRIAPVVTPPGHPRTIRGLEADERRRSIGRYLDDSHLFLPFGPGSAQR